MWKKIKNFFKEVDIFMSMFVVGFVVGIIVCIFLFLLATANSQISISENGLWKQEVLSNNLYTEIYFQAELGRWILEFNQYMVDLDGNPTKFILVEKWMTGTYRIPVMIDSIIVCKLEKFLISNKPVDLGDNVYYTFRIESDSIGWFGSLHGFNVYEMYEMKKIDL